MSRRYLALIYPPADLKALIAARPKVCGVTHASEAAARTALRREMAEVEQRGLPVSGFVGYVEQGRLTGTGGVDVGTKSLVAFIVGDELLGASADHKATDRKFWPAPWLEVPGWSMVALLDVPADVCKALCAVGNAKYDAAKSRTAAVIADDYAVGVIYTARASKAKATKGPEPERESNPDDKKWTAKEKVASYNARALAASHEADRYAAAGDKKGAERAEKYAGEMTAKANAAMEELPGKERAHPFGREANPAPSDAALEHGRKVLAKHHGDLAHHDLIRGIIAASDLDRAAALKAARDAKPAPEKPPKTDAEKKAELEAKVDREFARIVPFLSVSPGTDADAVKKQIVDNLQEHVRVAPEQAEAFYERRADLAETVRKSVTTDGYDAVHEALKTEAAAAEAEVEKLEAGPDREAAAEKHRDLDWSRRYVEELRRACPDVKDLPGPASTKEEAPAPVPETAPASEAFEPKASALAMYLRLAWDSAENPHRIRVSLSRHEADLEYSLIDTLVVGALSGVIMQKEAINEIFNVGRNVPLKRVGGFALNALLHPKHTGRSHHVRVTILASSDEDIRVVREERGQGRGWKTVWALESAAEVEEEAPKVELPAAPAAALAPSEPDVSDFEPEEVEDVEYDEEPLAGHDLSNFDRDAAIGTLNTLLTLLGQRQIARYYAQDVSAGRAPVIGKPDAPGETEGRDDSIEALLQDIGEGGIPHELAANFAKRNVTARRADRTRAKAPGKSLKDKVLAEARLKAAEELSDLVRKRVWAKAGEPRSAFVPAPVPTPLGASVAAPEISVDRRDAEPFTLTAPPASDGACNTPWVPAGAETRDGRLVFDLLVSAFESDRLVKVMAEQNTFAAIEALVHAQVTVDGRRALRVAEAIGDHVAYLEGGVGRDVIPRTDEGYRDWALAAICELQARRGYVAPSTDATALAALKLTEDIEFVDALRLGFIPLETITTKTTPDPKQETAVVAVTQVDPPNLAAISRGLVTADLWLDYDDKPYTWLPEAVRAYTAAFPDNVDSYEQGDYAAFRYTYGETTFALEKDGYTLTVSDDGLELRMLTDDGLELRRMLTATKLPGGVPLVLEFIEDADKFWDKYKPVDPEDEEDTAEGDDTEGPGSGFWVYVSYSEDAKGWASHHMPEAELLPWLQDRLGRAKGAYENGGISSYVEWPGGDVELTKLGASVYRLLVGRRDTRKAPHDETLHTLREAVAAFVEEVRPRLLVSDVALKMLAWAHAPAEAVVVSPPTIVSAPVVQIGCRMQEEGGRLNLYFTGKPDEAIRNRMKAQEFRWYGPAKTWYTSKITNGARALAQELCGTGAPQSTPAVVEPTAPVQEDVRAFVREVLGGAGPRFIQAGDASLARGEGADGLPEYTVRGYVGVVYEGLDANHAGDAFMEQYDGVTKPVEKTVYPTPFKARVPVTPAPAPAEKQEPEAKRETIWTTAPASLDIESTREEGIEPFTSDGKPVRRLSAYRWDTYAQEDRNKEAGHLTWRSINNIYPDKAPAVAPASAPAPPAEESMAEEFARLVREAVKGL